MHKSRALAAALTLLLAMPHAAAKTVEIKLDTSSKILVEDCRYDVTGKLQVTKTVYSSKRSG